MAARDRPKLETAAVVGAHRGAGQQGEREGEKREGEPEGGGPGEAGRSQERAEDGDREENGGEAAEGQQRFGPVGLAKAGRRRRGIETRELGGEGAGASEVLEREKGEQPADGEKDPRGKGVAGARVPDGEGDRDEREGGDPGGGEPRQNDMGRRESGGPDGLRAAEEAGA